MKIRSLDLVSATCRGGRLPVQPAERPLRELEPQQPVELRLRVAVLETWRFPLQVAFLEIGNETSSRCKVKTDLRVLAEKSTSSHPRGAGYVAAEESPVLRG